MPSTTDHPTKSNRRTKRKAAVSLKAAEKKRHVEAGVSNTIPPNGAHENLPLKTKKESIRQRITPRTTSRTTPKSKNSVENPGMTESLNEEEMAVFKRLKQKMELAKGTDSEEPTDKRDGEGDKKAPRRSPRVTRSSMLQEEDDQFDGKEDDDEEAKEDDPEDSDDQVSSSADEDEVDRKEGGVGYGERGESDDEDVVFLGTPSPPIAKPVVKPTYEEIASKGCSREQCSTIDQSVVTNLFKEVKEFIINHTEVHMERLVTEMKKDRDSMVKMEAHVEELSTIVSTSVATMFIKQPNAPPRLKEIHKKLCLLPALFNENFMLKVLSRTLMGSFLNMVQSGESYNMLEKQGLDMISIMYFAKQNNEKSKEKYSSAIGKLFSKFRQSLLSTAFLAMQTNSFQTFSDSTLIADITTVSPRSLSHENAASGAAEDTSPGMGNIISQPFWLKPKFVRIEHCHSALMKSERRAGTDSVENSQENGENNESEFLESSQSSARSKVSPRSGPITKEIASEAAYMVSKILTGIMNKCRQESKLELFNNVLYMFTGWAQHDITIDQRSLQLSWLKPASHDVEYMNKIPTTRPFRIADMGKVPGSDRQQLDLDNIKRLESFIGEYPELTIVAEHDVIVGEKPRRLYRRISLIECITKLIASYCTLESNSKSRDSLGIHKHCLKTVVVMAIGLRSLMEKVIHDVNTSKTVLWAGNAATKDKKGRPKNTSLTDNSSRPLELSTYKFESVSGLSLDNLQPSVSKQKVNLTQMILTMTEEEYAVKNYTPSTSGTSSFATDPTTQPNCNNNEEAHDDIIEADDNNGVFLM